MSWGRWFPSPFGARTEERLPPNSTDYYVTDEDAAASQHAPSYSYTPEYRYPPTHHSHQQHRPSRSHREDDILIFRFKSTNYPIKFEPYCIDDRRLTVGYAREKISEKLDIDDPDMIKMIHKGRKLDDDDVFFSDLGFCSDKPAEILCTLTGPPINRPSHFQEEEAYYSQGEDDVDDDAGSSVVSGATGASKNRKSKNKKKKKKAGKVSSAASPSSPTPTTTTTSSLPYPSAGAEYLPMPGHLHPATRPRPTATPSSTSRPDSFVSSSQPSPKPTPQVQTPFAKIEALASAFRDMIPKCEHFMQNMPQDKTKRLAEHKGLIYPILDQVISKLDGIDTEGDPDARARRKALVKEAQAMMTKLDQAAGVSGNDM